MVAIEQLNKCDTKVCMLGLQGLLCQFLDWAKSYQVHIEIRIIYSCQEIYSLVGLGAVTEW